VAIRGFRVQQLVVVTTLTDGERYPKDQIATLFRQRWHAEVYQADYDEKDNLYRGVRWAYSSRACVVEAGPLVPAAQAVSSRRRFMRSAKEGVVPPRAQSAAISVCC
jgi:hypothetical protein